jgi:hypothetical protein
MLIVVAVAASFLLLSQHGVFEPRWATLEPNHASQSGQHRGNEPRRERILDVSCRNASRAKNQENERSEQQEAAVNATGPKGTPKTTFGMIPRARLSHFTSIRPRPSGVASYSPTNCSNVTPAALAKPSQHRNRRLQTREGTSTRLSCSSTPASAIVDSRRLANVGRQCSA